MELTELDGKIFELGDLAMVPNPSDQWLGYAYLQMMKEGTLAIVFPEGLPTLSTFLWTFTRKGVTCFGCFRKFDDKVELVGIGRIDEPMPMGGGFKKSEITVAFFRQFWKRQYTLPLAQMMIEWVFKYTEADVLFGTTPDGNRAMVRFARNLGYEINYLPNYTTWNGQLCGVWVSSMTAAQWKFRTPF